MEEREVEQREVVGRQSLERTSSATGLRPLRSLPEAKAAARAAACTAVHKLILNYPIDGHAVTDPLGRYGAIRRHLPPTLCLSLLLSSLSLHLSLTVALTLLAPRVLAPSRLVSSRLAPPDVGNRETLFSWRVRMPFTGVVVPPAWFHSQCAFGRLNAPSMVKCPHSSQLPQLPPTAVPHSCTPHYLLLQFSNRHLDSCVVSAAARALLDMCCFAASTHSRASSPLTLMPLSPPPPTSPSATTAPSPPPAAVAKPLEVSTPTSAPR